MPLDEADLVRFSTLSCRHARAPSAGVKKSASINRVEHASTTVSSCSWMRARSVSERRVMLLLLLLLRAVGIPSSEDEDEDEVVRPKAFVGATLGPWVARSFCSLSRLSRSFPIKMAS
jgi:hypothetical protein